MALPDGSGEIPQLTEDGLLPAGVHATTFAELKARFGRFHASDRRVRLCEKLKQFLDLARSSGIVVYLIVDGSFVTAKEAPEDVDLIVVVSAQHGFADPLPPDAYNVVSGKRVKARFGFDAFVAPEGSQTLEKWIEFFAEVKGMPGVQKGILKVVP